MLDVIYAYVVNVINEKYVELSNCAFYYIVSQLYFDYSEHGIIS